MASLTPRLGHRSLAGLILTALLAGSVAPRVEADEATSLDQAITCIAGEVAAILGQETAVEVREFVGDSELLFSSDKGLRIRFVEALRARAPTATVAQGAPVVIEGSLEFPRQDGRRVGLLSVQVYKNGNKEGTLLTQVVVNDHVLTELAGLNVGLTPAALDLEKTAPEKLIIAHRDAIEGAFGRPEFRLKGGTVVSPTTEDRFGMEILIGGEPVPIFAGRNDVKDQSPADSVCAGPVCAGQPVFLISPDQSYRVRIHNRFDYDLAVRLTIDGLSSFEFSQDAHYRRNGVWIVPRGGAAVIPGWHDQGGRVKEFLVRLLKDMPDGHAAKLLETDNRQIATITARFYAAWTDREEKPADELGNSRGSREDLVGTIPGREIEVPLEIVQRFVGETELGAISIRYRK